MRRTESGLWVDNNGQKYVFNPDNPGPEEMEASRSTAQSGERASDNRPRRDADGGASTSEDLMRHVGRETEDGQERDKRGEASSDDDKDSTQKVLWSGST